MSDNKQLLMDVKNGYKGKIVLFTMYYKQLAYAQHTQSLVNTITCLERLGVKWDYFHKTGEAMPLRAMNEMLTLFINSDATDFLNIDSDISWSPEGVLRLLTHKEDIVYAAYRMTNRQDLYVGSLKWGNDNGIEHPVGKSLPDGTTLLESTRAPGGFLRIKKTALEKFVAKYPDRWYWQGDEKIIQFFGDAPVVDHVLTTNDYIFSNMARDAGIEIWCDPNIHITHWDMKGYEGNYDKHLRDNITRKDEAEAFKIVKQMAANL